MGTRDERERILEELASLPAGTIVHKRIGGREQPYLQWREGGKVRSRYLKAAERENVAQQVARRQELSAQLKELDASQSMPSGTPPSDPPVRDLRPCRPSPCGPCGARRRLATP